MTIDYASIQCEFNGCPHVGVGEHTLVHILPAGGHAALRQEQHWLATSGHSVGTFGKKKHFRGEDRRRAYRRARDAARRIIERPDNSDNGRQAVARYMADSFGAWGTNKHVHAEMTGRHW